MNKLTNQQNNVLAFITCFISKKCFSPTVKEISNHFGFKSPNAAQCHINALIQKGAITATPKTSRSIVVVEQDKEWIPTSYGTPSDYGDYLATDGKCYFTMFYAKGWYFSHDKKADSSLINITHWSALPKQPKGANNG